MFIRNKKMFKKHGLSSGVQASVGWIVASSLRSFCLLFILSMAFHVNQLNQIPHRDLVPSAYRELGAIAISLQETGQFANPYMIPTGPTAHLPPLIPFIISVIYRLFGLTSTAGYFSKLFIIVNGTLLYALLPWLSDKLGTTKQAGFVGGLAGIFFMEFHGHGEYLTGLVLGFFLVAFLQRWTKKTISWVKSFLLGIAIGVAFHMQPALLPVIVGCLVFELWWSRNQRKWFYLSLLVFGIFIACIPWGWRNYTTFNAIFFIRSNFGLELRLGNHEGAAASMEVLVAQEKDPRHPKANFSEVRKLKELGEIEYMRQARQEAFNWIKTHPRDFAWLTLQRFANLWAGPLHSLKEALSVFTITILAFWGAWRTLPRLTLPQRASYLIPLVTYPNIYYVVAYLPRYRVPIDWILFTFAGALVWSWIRPDYNRKM
jgi:hypothetical protein